MNIPLRAIPRGANDNTGLDPVARAAAVDLIRQSAESGAGMLKAAECLGSAMAWRFNEVVLAMELDGLVHVERDADHRPLRGTLTEFGMYVGERLVAGGIALMSAKGGIKVADTPKIVEGAEAAGRRKGRGTNGRVFGMIAIAPDHYGPDIVEGAASHAVLELLKSWIDHPLWRSCDPRGTQSVQRAWEVYSWDGRSHGIVAETDRGFRGIAAHGGACSEASLSEAAWQILMNS